MDLERAMQFILDAQAQQAVTLQEHTVALRRLDERLVAVTDLVGRLAQAELRLVEEMRAADERSKAADQRSKAADERSKAADERGKDTDARLNALIKIVDQMIRRNGKN